MEIEQYARLRLIECSIGLAVVAIMAGIVVVLKPWQWAGPVGRFLRAEAPWPRDREGVILYARRAGVGRVDAQMRSVFFLPGAPGVPVGAHVVLVFEGHVWSASSRTWTTFCPACDAEGYTAGVNGRGCLACGSRDGKTKA